jgi:hypothetical protein
MALHAAAHRGLRELHASARAMARHWSSLGPRLGGPEGELLQAGAADARALVTELAQATADRGLPADLAAASAGRIASPRTPVPDRVLERGQALRLALLEAQHVVTLLGYLRELAAHDGDDELRALLGRFEEGLGHDEATVRAAAIALGARPDDAIVPADRSWLGRAGARVGWALGAVGEWTDRRAGPRPERRP